MGTECNCHKSEVLKGNEVNSLQWNSSNIDERQWSMDLAGEVHNECSKIGFSKAGDLEKEHFNERDFLYF